MKSFNQKAKTFKDGQCSYAFSYAIYISISVYIHVNFIHFCQSRGRAVCVYHSCLSHIVKIIKARKAVSKGDSSQEAYFSRRISFKVFNGFYVKINLVHPCKRLCSLRKGKVVFVYISYAQFCFTQYHCVNKRFVYILNCEICKI